MTERIAIACPGPSFPEWDIDWSWFDKIYGVNHGALLAPCHAFIALDGRTHAWAGHEFPIHIPQITERHFPGVLEKHAGQFSFPTLLAFVHKHHPGAEVHLFGVDFDGADAVTGTVSSDNRWRKERREVEQVVKHFEPGLLHWYGAFKPNQRRS